MLIAGEPSGDRYGAALAQALRAEFADIQPAATMDYQPLDASLEPRIFGAGGPRMAAAGVDLAFDMTQHSVFGFVEALKQYRTFRGLFRQLLRVALDRQPDAIVCVDFAGFNRRFAHAIKQFVRARQGWFHDWNPRLIQYVSPQVWASRPNRAFQLASDYDALLSIFPFEKRWYARRVPAFRVEFVGHPMMDCYRDLQPNSVLPGKTPSVLLLPGSRRGEIRHHMPVMTEALAIMRRAIPELRARMVVPDERLLELAKTYPLPPDLQIQTDGLATALAEAQVAIAKSGTVTMDCAYFGLPTVALYKTSQITFEVAKRMVRVDHVAMPNLLAKEEIFPEFLQNAATPETIANAALDLLRDEPRRTQIKLKLARVIASLGGVGASRRAARTIVELIRTPQSSPVLDPS